MVDALAGGRLWTAGVGVVHVTALVLLSIACCGPPLWAAEASGSIMEVTSPDCGTLPKRQVRINVTVTSPWLPDLARITRDVVAEVWTREGIQIDWMEKTSSVKLEDVDAWIFASERRRASSEPDVLGAVSFVQGIPRPLIVLSVDAVIRWFSRQQNAQLGFEFPLSPLQTLLVADGRRQVSRALGYVAAHELGHLWLGTRSHEKTGLMQAAFGSFERLQSDSSQTRLDQRSRQRLAQRLSQAENCR